MLYVSFLIAQTTTVSQKQKIGSQDSVPYSTLLFSYRMYEGGGPRWGSTVVKVLCFKSEGRWFDLSWCQWIFH